MASRNVKDHIEIFQDYDVYIPTRTISITMDIDDELASKVIKNLYILDVEKDQPINVILNCQGGDIGQAFAIYDALKLCKNEIIIRALGHVQSAAVIILQAGSKRTLTSNTRLMIHQGYLELAEDGVPNIYKTVEENKQYDKMYERVLIESMKDVEKKTLRKMLSTHTYMDAETAVRYGLADEVING